MKPFFKISRLPIVLLIVFTVFENVAEAQVHPLVSCTITGSSSVSLGSTSTYNCSCSASSWTVTCGTIQSSTSTSVTVHFNVYDCNLATIKANGTTAATKTVTVTYPPLAGGTISNTNQNINYNTALRRSMHLLHQEETVPATLINGILLQTTLLTILFQVPLP